MSEGATGGESGSWRKRHPLLSRAIVALLFLLLGLSFYGLKWSSLVPTKLGTELGYVAAAVGVIAGILLAIPTPARGPEWIGFPPFRYPLVALFSGLLFYAAIGRGLPSLYTEMAGTPGQQIVTVDHWRSGSARRCSGPQLIEEPILSTVACLDNSWSDKMTEGTQLVALGKASIFGIEVNTLRVVASPPALGPSASERAANELSMTH